MEKNRSKVLMSILIIALCLAVCVGLTYAYFTDSAKSSGNKIQAGNLKLDLQLYGKTDGWRSIKDSQDPVFNYDKWEPGYVDVKLLKIENLGDLAMQWEAKIVSTETISELANVIEVYVQTSNSEMPYPTSRAEALAWTKVGTLNEFINAGTIANGTFTTQGECAYISIALYMPAEITDNTLQEKVVGEFDIQINATQLAYESDAFDESYDTDAKLPCNHIESDWLVDVAADEGIEGSRHTECTVCGEQIRQETIPALPISEFTWKLNDDGNSYTVTGLKEPETVENIEIPATYKGLPVTAIENSAFSTDYTIERVIIPDSVTTIGNSAFYTCAELTSLTIGNGVTTIDSYAFQSCSGLTSITIPDSVISIGEAAFSYCYGVESIVFGENSQLTTIGNSAFYSCSGLTSITIPDSTTSIGDAAFQSCSGLTSITISDSVISIGDAAFSYCYGVESIVFGENSQLTTIGNSAFFNSYQLTSIDIPDSVTTIEDGAFAYCFGLTSIDIPDSVTYIGMLAFSECSALTRITFEGTTEQWSAISFGDSWKDNAPATEVVCSDGTVALN